jgi:hypothetical protein
LKKKIADAKAKVFLHLEARVQRSGETSHQIMTRRLGSFHDFCTRALSFTLYQGLVKRLKDMWVIWDLAKKKNHTKITPSDGKHKISL